MKQPVAVFFLLLLTSGFAFTQTFQPAMVSDLLPAPVIHERFELLDRFDTIKNLAPGTAYESQPILQDPYSAGNLQTQYVDHGLATLNFFRFMSGLDDVKTDAVWSDIAQHGAALLAIINKGLNHTPSYPAGIRLPRAFYDKGYLGTSTSNLHQGQSNLGQAVKSLMDDSDAGNIDRLGHRRWIVSPSLSQVGFGSAHGFVALKVFGTGSAESGTKTSYVAWPGVGDQVLGWFDGSQAWSFSINPDAFEGGIKGSRKSIIVRLRRQRDERAWSFSGGKSDGYFNVETANFGLPFCIIFRPDALGSLLDGDLFTVTITGVSDNKGKPIPINYETRFFGAGASISAAVQSKKPSEKIIHAASESQGKQMQAARMNGMQSTMGYAGPALSGFYWYVDSPDGILPIGIEINNDGIIHAPGEIIKAPEGGIYGYRLVSTESGLQYTSFAKNKWAAWVRSGEFSGFDKDTPIETISIMLK